LANHRQPYKEVKELANQQPPRKKALKMRWPISGLLFHIRYLTDRSITFVPFAAYELFFERLRSRNFCCHIVDRNVTSETMEKLNFISWLQFN
jgi:hypothetical protein